MEEVSESCAGEVASMRILVVCGAGASSTFVAQRLRRAATAAGRDWHASAGTESAIASSVADLVLIGPHLADRLPTIRAATGAPIVVLPDDVFGDRDGTRTLALAEAALHGSASEDANRSTAKGTS
jgi:PTS system cellobiose-specific IIB component